MKKRNLVAFGIGIILLAYIIYSLEPRRIIDALLHVRLEYFLLAGLFYFLNDILAALSLKIVTSSNISLLEMVASHMCGMFYSNATPGRLGYYYTALSISKKTNTSRSGNIGILTLFQGINLLTKVFLCIMAVAYFSSLIIDRESQNYLLYVSMFPIFGVFLIALTLYTNLSNRFLDKIPVLKNFTKYVGLMQDTVRNLEKERIMKLITLIILGWLSMSAQWFFLSASMGIDVSYTTALMLQPLLTTVMFVPISPSGLGIAEGGSALLFNALGYTLETGTAFMLLFRINSIFVDLFGVIDMKIHHKK